MTASAIYFIGVLDNMHHLFSSVCIVGGVLSAMFFTFWIVAKASNDEHAPKLKSVAVLCLLITIVSNIITAFLPTSKVAAAMYVIPAIANNEDAQVISNNSLEVLRKLTTQWLKELQETTNE